MAVGLSYGVDLLKDSIGAIRLPHEDRTLRQRLLVSTTYSTIEFGSSAVLRLVSTVIMSRLLDPATFGVFAVVNLFLYIIQTFTDIGLRPIALSHERKLTHEFLQSIWTVKIVRGLLLTLVLLLISYGVSIGQGFDLFAPESAYSNQELPYLLAAVSLVLVIKSTSSPNALLLDAKLNHDKIFLFSMASLLFKVVLPIATVYVVQDVWGLVIASILVAIGHTIATNLYYKGASFKIRLPREDLMMFIDRGKWLIAQTSLTSFGRIADRLVLGLMLTDARFGLYYLATQLAQMSSALLMTIQGKVGIQMFREIDSGTPEQFRQKYYKLRALYDTLALTICGFVFAISPLLIDVVYDDRYAEVATFLQILVFNAVLLGPNFLRQAFIANREFKYTTQLALLRTVCIWGGLLFSVFVVGSVHMAMWFIALHQLPEVLVFLYHGYKRGWVDPVKEIRMAPMLLVGFALGYGFDASVSYLFSLS